MPDVFTHLMVGTSIALLARRDDNRPAQIMIVLGALLIDIERPISWLIEGTWLDWIGLGAATHSFLGAIGLSYFAAVCFISDDIPFVTRFWLIFIGCSSHLLLDLVMYPWIEIGLYLLYPIMIPFSFNLLWPDFWFYPVFGCVFFIIVYLCRHWLINESGN